MPPKTLQAPRPTQRGQNSIAAARRRDAIVGGHLILRLIQSGPGWNPKRLAERLRVSEKTVYRYLRDLAAAGVEIEFDRKTRGYRLTEAYIPPPIQLTEEEAFALAAVCQEVGGQIAYLRPVETALQKIRDILPHEVSQDLDAVAKHVVIKTAPSARAGGRDEEAYRTIRRALREQRILECRYESVSGREDSDIFEFQPYSLFYAVRAWYTIGRHSRRPEGDDVRCLKLKRFSHLRLMNKPYTLPPDFSLREHLGNAWSMIRGTPEYDVEIWIDAAFCATLTDTQWHRTQKIEHRPDGSAIFRCTVSGLDEIVWWVLGLGPQAKVIRPLELAQRVEQLARQTADGYRRSSDPEPPP